VTKNRKDIDMSIYTCPACGKKGFNPYTKGMAGKMNSKGRPCKHCGTRCVNGKGATIFNAVFSLIMFIGFVSVFILVDKYEAIAIREVPLYILMLLAELIVPRLVNAFCFRMTESIRLDL